MLRRLYFLERISWTDRARSEEVLHKVKEDKNALHTKNKRKDDWIGHILRRNCLLKHIIEGRIEGKIEMTGRVGRRRNQLLDDLRKLFKCLQYCGYLSHKNRKDNFCGTKDQQYRSVTTLCTKMRPLPGLLMRSEFASRVILRRDLLKEPEQLNVGFTVSELILKRAPIPRQPKRWKNNN